MKKIKMTKTVTLDDKAYNEAWWANFDNEEYLEKIPELTSEEIDNEDAEDDEPQKIKRIERTMNNAILIELHDLRENDINMDDLQVADSDEEYEIVDDSVDEYVEPFGGGTK